MKRIGLVMVLGLCLASPSLLTAQDHVQVGVFADYFKLGRTTPDINFVGVGARVGFNIRPSVVLEAEMAYDFKRNFTSVFSDGINTQFVNTRLRPLHAMFGPKFQTGNGPFRAFVTGKLGFVNFSTSDQNALSGFEGSLGAITSGNTRFALYPGAGVEGFWGPFGMRLDVGDQIYFDNGARNNLKVTLGPVVRF